MIDATDKIEKACRVLSQEVKGLYKIDKGATRKATTYKFCKELK